MSENFTFSKNKIADHIEKVGVEIRPIIECRMDRMKLTDFGNKLLDKYPNLYESVSQSATAFELRKKFFFPGKGTVDFVTFALSQEGLIFSFPRKLALIDEEFDLGNIKDVAVECLKEFKKIFSERKFLRFGFVNEYIFDLGPQISTKLIAGRFTKIPLVPDGEILLRINNPTDDFNRIIIIDALLKNRPDPDFPGKLKTEGFGVKVIVDFNNRDKTVDLDNSKILNILHEGGNYNNKEMYQFLNGIGENGL